jgi:hypothetical protein
MFQQSRKARRGQDKTSQLLEWSLRAIRRSRQANFIEVAEYSCRPSIARTGRDLCWESLRTVYIFHGFFIIRRA